MRASRRLFLAAGLLAAALARGQGRHWRIAVVSPDAEQDAAGISFRKRLPAELAKAGYEEGRNLAIEWVWPDATTTLEARVAAAVRRGPDLIVARTNDPIQAAIRATRDIPIVMLNGNFPVEIGFVSSLSHPGANVTGTAYAPLSLVGKLVELLREVAPAIRSVAMLGDSLAVPVGPLRKNALEEAGRRYGMVVRYEPVGRVGDLDAALGRIAADRMQGLVSAGNASIRARDPDVIDFTLRHKMPSIAGIASFATQGGLLDYAPDADEYWAQTVRYVDRILRGAKPGLLPVAEPTRYTLSVNLKTARAIGLAVPSTVLARAQRVLE